MHEYVLLLHGKHHEQSVPVVTQCSGWSDVLVYAWYVRTICFEVLLLHIFCNRSPVFGTNQLQSKVIYARNGSSVVLKGLTQQRNYIIMEHVCWMVGLMEGWVLFPRTAAVYRLQNETDVVLLLNCKDVYATSVLPGYAFNLRAQLLCTNKYYCYTADTTSNQCR